MWITVLVVLGLAFIVSLVFLFRRFYYNHLVCGYCGTFTPFSLCFECQQLLKRKSIYYCYNCENYFSSEKPCDCSAEERTSEYKERKRLEYENEISTLRSSLYDGYSGYSRTANLSCFICGADSADKHLCRECYNKYKGHDVLLKLEAGRKVTVQEKYYEGTRIITADGHNVRSDGERAIDNYFFYNNIPHAYEKPLYLDKSKYNVDSISPDFYLPHEDTYVEFLGYSGEQYVKENEFKRKIYTELGLTVIYLYRDDKDTLDAKLDYYLRNIEHGKLNHIRLDSNGNMVI